MAGFNEILVGRFNRMLQKLLSMKGPASMNELSTTFQTALEVFHGAEDRYLEGWYRFGMGLQQAALAAVNSGIQLRNPPTSNAVVVLEKVALAESVADSFCQVNLGATVADLATVIAAPGPIDPRGNQNSVSIISRATNILGIGPLISGSPLLAGAGNIDLIFTHDQELTVFPGFALRIATNAVNTTLSATMLWRERPLEDSELK